MKNTSQRSKISYKKYSSGVAVIEMNGEKLNALSTQMLKLLTDKLLIAEKSDGVRVIVIYGGKRAFSSGTDVSEFKNKKSLDMIHDQRSEYWSIIKSLKKPLIAAVNRFAVGSGCELAMICDIVIASEDACFGHPEIKLGLMPGAGGTIMLTQALGKARAMKMLLTGEYINAHQALEFGLVSQVVDASKTLSYSLELAANIAEKSPLAVRFIKQSVLLSLKNGVESTNKIERLLFSHLFSTELNLPD